MPSMPSSIKKFFKSTRKRPPLQSETAQELTQDVSISRSGATAVLQGTVFRVTGIPLSMTVDELGATFSSEFSSEDVALDIDETTLCLSCYDKRTQTALIQFTPHPPQALEGLAHHDTYQLQLKLGGSGQDLSIDKDFYGLTQLYPTTEEAKADIVAVCGLNGHAYGSWASKSQRNQQKMWLRHFLHRDLPQCRTMIYGYNTDLESNSIHMIPDYTDSLLEELKKSRQSEVEKNRPIVFIGHSFGGIIIAQSIVKAKDHGSVHDSLFSCIRATIFFGTPHRGLVVDDILAMLNQNPPREPLVESIRTGSAELNNELRRFINYSALMNLKIVSFKETKRTKKLRRGPDGRWTRSGEYFNTVDETSSVLQLPGAIEEALPAEGDRSTMVKFKHSGHQSYTSVVRHLKNFTLDNGIEKGGPITAYSAVANNNANALRRLLQTTSIDMEKRYKNNKTLLHIAICNGSKTTVSILLAHSADPEAVDENGNTGLHLAALGGHDEVVDILLNNGADIETKNHDSKLALHLAAGGGFEKMVEVLLKHGANISARNENGDTALQIATEKGHEGVAEVLLNTTVKDRDGAKGLHHAAKGYARELKKLLRNRVEIEVKDKHGNTVLHYVAQGYLKEVSQL